MIENFSNQQLLEELKFRSTSTESDRSLFESLRASSSKEIFNALRLRQGLIYGNDDRRDVFLLRTMPIAAPTALTASARGVVAVFHQAQIRPDGPDTSKLITLQYGSSYSLCESEPFRKQPTGAWCTGFLVGRQIIATAGHSLGPTTLDKFRFVFGFEMLDPDTAQLIVGNDQIYRGVKFLGWSRPPADADWALIELDRPVPDHEPLPVRRSGEVAVNQAVHVFGHPKGLPLKFSDSAVVRDNTRENYFVANLDTYTGNSGSPVLNDDEHFVEGILIRGMIDFRFVDGCQKSLVCPMVGGGPDCVGEFCMKITKLAHLIPEES